MEDLNNHEETKKSPGINKKILLFTILLIVIIITFSVFFYIYNQQSAPEKTIDSFLNALNQREPDAVIEISTLKYMGIPLQTEYAIYIRDYPYTFSNTKIEEISYSDTMTDEEKANMLEEINIPQFEQNHNVDITDYCYAEINGDIYDIEEGTTLYNEEQDLYLVLINDEWLIAGFD